MKSRIHSATRNWIIDRRFSNGRRAAPYPRRRRYRIRAQLCRRVSAWLIADLAQGEDLQVKRSYDGWSDVSAQKPRWKTVFTTPHRADEA